MMGLNEEMREEEELSTGIKQLTFNTYQFLARSTAIYPEKHRIVYPALGLSGESGEVAEKIKKWLRDGKSDTISIETIDAVEKELGDVLWYLANLAEDLGLKLEDIAAKNIAKLASRKERNKLHGSGDNR